jgi:hypothetical protein
MKAIPKTERSYFLLTALRRRHEREIMVDRYHRAFWDDYRKARLANALKAAEERRLALAARTRWQRFCDWFNALNIF